MNEIYLALGSNRGDRLANLRLAVEKLGESGVFVEKKSKIYQTQSVENGGDGDFLNAVVRAQFSGQARALLTICQRIEAEMGREMPPRSGARSIDLDILLFGDEIHANGDLTIPHPRMNARAFVLRPLLDVLTGGWVEESPHTWE